MNGLKFLKVAAFTAALSFASPTRPVLAQAAAPTIQAQPPAAQVDTLRAFGPGLVAAVVTLLGAWFVTLALSAQWEARKKRAELDIALARDFYKLVASFKAIAREGRALGSRPQISPQDWDTRHAELENQGNTPGVAALGPRPRQTPDEWDKWHADLLRRAIVAEADMEAILLALISEGSIDEGVTQEQRQRRLRASGLLRVAFRGLREQIQHRQMRMPPFDDPLFWLMNRVEGELSRLVFARSVRKLRKPKSSAVQRNAADYLNLIAYRTADLETAAAHLATHTAVFIGRRRESREEGRRANVRNLFREASFVIAASPNTVPPLVNATIVVVVSNQKAFPDDLDQQADALLTANPALTHVLFIGDHLDTGQPPGAEETEIHAVYVKGRAIARVICETDEALPLDLPYKSPAELLGIPSWLPRPIREWLVRRRRGLPPLRGVSLLAWSLDAEGTDALRRMAETEI